VAPGFGTAFAGLSMLADGFEGKPFGGSAFLDFIVLMN